MADERDIGCKDCINYWQDLKACGKHSIFMPDEVCDDFGKRPVEHDKLNDWRIFWG